MCEGEKDLRALGIVCHISSITRPLYWAWHGSDPYCHLQIYPPPAHTHFHTHMQMHTHMHAYVCMSGTRTHALSCIHKPAHMACKEFIWCFLVIATKTPNLDVSHSFPRTPEWRANFKQPPPLTRRPLSFFFSFFSFSSLSHLSKKAVFYTRWQLSAQTVICLREVKNGLKIPGSVQPRKVSFMPLCLQIPHVWRYTHTQASVPGTQPPIV